MDQRRFSLRYKGYALVVAFFLGALFSSTTAFATVGFQTDTIDYLGNATSGQSGAPSFASSTPFGHFLMNQNSYPTSVHNGQLLWYPSSTLYASYVDAGSATWNALGGVTIASTTSAASTSTVVVSDFNLVDISYLANWTPNTATTSPKLKFNQYDIDQAHPSTTTIQQAATHELGHALGLDHSYYGNIMYYTAPPTVTTLQSQDISDYHFLWGGN